MKWRGSYTVEAAVIIPVLIWTIVYMITNRSLTYVITSAVMITSFIITMYSVLSYIGSRYEHFENAVLAKDRMLDKAMDINREMLEKQEKLYYVNEQLALKRIELESANSKINANILEMHFQNEMLHYFTEAFDIVKINDYFAGKLISDIGIRTAGLLKTAVNGERSIYEDYKKNNPMYDISARYKLFGDINEAAADVLYDMFTCDEFMKRLEDGHIFICENVKHTEYEGLKSYHILSARSVDGEYGTGHNAYVIDEDGIVWNTYHARPGADGPRSTGIRRVHFDVDGCPMLDVTEDRDMTDELRKVEVDIILV